eukprot:29785-Pelagococcus_subviridis.AAC.4
MGGDRRREKSLRIGVHRGDAAVWGPVRPRRRRRDRVDGPPAAGTAAGMMLAEELRRAEGADGGGADEDALGPDVCEAIGQSNVLPVKR